MVRFPYQFKKEHPSAQIERLAVGAQPHNAVCPARRPHGDDRVHVGGVESLLPFASVAITNTGYWTQNAQKIRLAQLVGSPCTLTYDLIIRSWGGALSEGIAIASILVSIWRFGWNDLAQERS